MVNGELNQGSTSPSVVLYCSSLGQACGIATYTCMLSEAQNIPTVRRLEDLENPPEYLHVQHEFGIMPSEELRRVITYCKNHSVRLYITMHLVVPFPDEMAFTGLSYHIKKTYIYLMRLYRDYILDHIELFLNRDHPLTDKINQIRATLLAIQKRTEHRYKIGHLDVDPWPVPPLSTLDEMKERNATAGFILATPFFKDQQIIIRNAARIIVHSEPARRALINQGTAYRQMSVFTHPLLSAPVSDRLHSDADHRLHVGCFGFLNTHKGLREVIEACTKIPDVSLHVYACAGHQDKPHVFEAEILQRAKAHDWIELNTDFLPLPDIIYRLSQCDVNVWYVQQYPHGLSASGSLRQYIAARRPIIASDIPMVDDVRSLVQTVPPNNTEFLAEAIRKFDSDTTKIETYADKYTWDKAKWIYE